MKLQSSPFLFAFKTPLEELVVPSQLNNPFKTDIPEIAQIAAREFQDFLVGEAENWKVDFDQDKGKMFGVLVVQNTDENLQYLGTVSGKLPNGAFCKKFVPSVFDEAAGDYFINRGMEGLTALGKQIEASTSEEEIDQLKALRRLKSHDLQQRLFENYHFSNLSGKTLNVIEIFEASSHGNPPAAAGECAAPKLLQFALNQQLKPIALAEFWWGRAASIEGREHKVFYPACKNKCRPILEFMLEDNSLYNSIH